MNKTQIVNQRLFNQFNNSADSTNPAEIVRYMTAMQAQDYAMAKWAIGIRMKNTTDKAIEAVFNEGEILRTHVMRPTWHFVHANDIHWMIDLTAPRILSSIKSRHQQLELTPDVINKSNDLISSYLARNGATTRKELVVHLADSGFKLDDNRGAHLLMIAELEKIICSGPAQGKNQTYDLLENKVSHPQSFSHEEALNELALRYFRAHGPATLQDFIWWSGLPVKDARKALEMIKPNFSAIETDKETYWTENDMQNSIRPKNHVILLPAYDEYIISYKDRSLILAPDYQQKTISNNGIFWPTIIVNGLVKGLWKRTLKKELIEIEIKLFEKLPNQIMENIEDQAQAYAKFHNKSVTLTHQNI